MIKVALSDSHKLVTQSLEALLSQSGDIEVVGHAFTNAQCEALLGQHRTIDVLLLDVEMSDGSSLDHLHSWKSSYPALRILVLSAQADPLVIRHALSCGADGYVLKTCGKEALLEGLQTVIQHETYLCPEVNAILQSSPQVNAASLTPREQEVLRLIVEGYSIKMIADQLCLGFETVHSYYKYIKHKLGVHNTAALVRVALRQKLV